MGDAAAAEGSDLLLVTAFALNQPDPGAELLAQLGIGDPHHLHIGDLRVGVEKLLDLAGVDVLSAADDHVLDPPHDIAVALLVDDTDIAGMHPALGVDRFGGPLRIVPIAQHHRITAGAELARDPAWRDPALRVDGLDLKVGLHPSD